MSCTGCTTKFGFLKTERGCPGCGFSYCGKCLSEKTILKEGAKPVSVCKNCANREKPSNRRESQPAMGSAQEKGYNELPPSMRQAAKARTASMTTTSLSPEEKALRERLDRLKEEMRPDAPVSQTELEIRLAKLKGKSFDENVAQKSKPFYFGPDNRTPAQRASDLMAQMREEMELERRQRRPDQEIAERLAKLKEDNPTSEQSKQDTAEQETVSKSETKSTLDKPVPGATSCAGDETELSEVEKLLRQAQSEAEDEGKIALKEFEKDQELQEQLKRLNAERWNRTNKKTTSGDSSSEDESSEAEKIAKAIIEEDEIAVRLSQLAPPPVSLGDCTPTTPSSTNENESEDELPWCCICNEDASLRCLGCDGDLYCQTCYRKGHDKFDMDGHRTAPYKAKETGN